MPIQKKPTVSAVFDPAGKTAEAFIEAAPDGVRTQPAKTVKGRVYKQRKVPVSFTAEQDLLNSFDQKAFELGMSRAALLALAMSRVVRGDL
ncbi:hypothetical protein U4I67_21950 [Stenotrophomonas maltophilia]|uniref:hypothetical protein n=1 Tax=Stenotrophomonas maltophilia TaxID=40324 RepID=UPI002ACC3F75|nr:hypothetical protein [Stenotrophomonas maltophilia]MDZ5781606.1 hypothetical protein [Stenotrophomonas maltophilia]